MAELVFNIRPAAPSDIRALTMHELHRTPDGNSAIDPDRSHLNRILIGPKSQQAALDLLFSSGVKRPAAHAEAPYVQLVIGASPEYFRPDDPEAEGHFEPDRLELFVSEVLDWLRFTFDDDAIHASLHLDETTPHIHALIAPTYRKKARTPGRRKRSETEAAFEARKKAALEAPFIRTVGRSSNDTFARPNSFEQLRRSLADQLAHLSIEYGTSRTIGAPQPRKTYDWLKVQNTLARAEGEQLEAEIQKLHVENQKLKIDHDEAVTSREAALEQAHRAERELGMILGALEAFRPAHEALKAWEQRKADQEWMAMSPQARAHEASKHFHEVLNARNRARDAGEREALTQQAETLRAEADQLRAEAGTIIELESLDLETGHLEGRDLRTGEHVAARLILDPAEYGEAYIDHTMYFTPEARRAQSEPGFKG